jgi:hypothetical protein
MCTPSAGARVKRLAENARLVVDRRGIVFSDSRSLRDSCDRYTMQWMYAKAIASPRPRTPSFEKMRPLWLLTVAALM